MPPLPSRPDIMYSAPAWADFEPLMRCVEGGEAKVLVGNPMLSNPTRYHLFARHEVPDSEIMGTAIGDRILPVLCAIGYTTCASTAEYEHHFGLGEGVPRVVEGVVE